MGRIFGIILIVAAIYFASNHVSRRDVRVGDEKVPLRSTPEYVGDRVQDAFEQGNRLRDAAMPDD